MADQVARSQPAADSFRHVGPSGFDHHVVSHAGKEFGFGLVGARRGVHLGVGDQAVVPGAENQHRGWRRQTRIASPSTPCGGTDAMTAAAGARRFSRYRRAEPDERDASFTFVDERDASFTLVDR